MLLYTHGTYWPDLGYGAFGIIATDRGGRRILARGGRLSADTSNQAEYEALAEGLRQCSRYSGGQVICHTTSQLVVNQMLGQWLFKKPRLYELAQLVIAEASSFGEVLYERVRKQHIAMKSAVSLAQAQK